MYNKGLKIINKKVNEKWQNSSESYSRDIDSLVLSQVPLNLFRYVVARDTQRLNVFCKKAIRRGTLLSGNFYNWKKNSQMKNVPFISIFEAFSPLIFLRFSEVGFSPFRDFPGLIIICKNRLLKFLASETVTERGIAKCWAFSKRLNSIKDFWKSDKKEVINSHGLKEL